MNFEASQAWKQHEQVLPAPPLIQREKSNSTINKKITTTLITNIAKNNFTILVLDNHKIKDVLQNMTIS